MFQKHFVEFRANLSEREVELNMFSETVIYEDLRHSMHYCCALGPRSLYLDKEAR
jgi:hypothetical protein